MKRYLALLRGINVGGNNLIAMRDLVACFEQLGFADVSTYIQSGNVLFDGKGERAALTRRIERGLAARFGYAASIVLRTRDQLRAIVERAPRGFGARPAEYRYDVLFLKEPLTAKQAMPSVPTREGVDEAHAGPGVLYFSRLAARATQSLLPKLAGKPIYKQLTVRNWNTTTRLLALMS